jgi:hypothetical protein
MAARDNPKQYFASRRAELAAVHFTLNRPYSWLVGVCGPNKLELAEKHLTKSVVVANIEGGVKLPKDKQEIRLTFKGILRAHSGDKAKVVLSFAWCAQSRCWEWMATKEGRCDCPGG